jgi:hypothetical protein
MKTEEFAKSLMILGLKFIQLEIYEVLDDETTWIYDFSKYFEKK